VIETLFAQLQSRFSNYQFRSAANFAWSPQTQVVYYRPESLQRAEGYYRLLHELSHAELGHSSYRYDIELIRMEIAAWHYAQSLAKEIKLSISEHTCDEHLETYRDWLYARSRCPTCHATGLQNDLLAYVCSHCRTSWGVPRAQLCQVQRRLQSLPTPI
jgi:hypothetical protein